MLKRSFGVLCQPTPSLVIRPGSGSLSRLYAIPTPSSISRSMLERSRGSGGVVTEQLANNVNGMRYLSRMSERELERVRHVHNKSTREWRNLRAGPRMALVVFGLFLTGGAVIQGGTWLMAGGVSLPTRRTANGGSGSGSEKLTRRQHLTSDNESSGNDESVKLTGRAAPLPITSLPSKRQQSKASEIKEIRGQIRDSKRAELAKSIEDDVAKEAETSTPIRVLSPEAIVVPPTLSSSQLAIATASLAKLRPSTPLPSSRPAGDTTTSGASTIGSEASTLTTSGNAIAVAAASSPNASTAK
jgi:hypothetical protein